MSEPETLSAEVARELLDTDIRWNLEPLEAVPTDDLLTDVLVEAESYRLLAQQAIHALHDLQRRYDRLKERHFELLRARRGAPA